MRIISYLIFVLSFFLMSEINAGELKINVTNIKNNIGSIHYALYNTPEKFPNSNGALLGGNKDVEKVLIDGLTISNLKESLYAIAIYHDENSNNQFDTFFSIPTERYGFSNDAPVFLGPPKFDDASIFIPRDKIVQIEIKLR